MKSLKINRCPLAVFFKGLRTWFYDSVQVKLDGWQSPNCCQKMKCRSLREAAVFSKYFWTSFCSCRYLVPSLMTRNTRTTWNLSKIWVLNWSIPESKLNLPKYWHVVICFTTYSKTLIQTVLVPMALAALLLTKYLLNLYCLQNKDLTGYVSIPQIFHKYFSISKNVGFIFHKIWSYILP